MLRRAFIEVEFIENGGGPLPAGGRVAAVKIVRVEGEAGGYLAGLAAGDVVFIRRGKGWVLKKTPGGKLFLVPENAASCAGRSVAPVGVAGIMRKMA